MGVSWAKNRSERAPSVHLLLQLNSARLRPQRWRAKVGRPVYSLWPAPPGRGGPKGINRARSYLLGRAAVSPRTLVYAHAFSLDALVIVQLFSGAGRSVRGGRAGRGAGRLARRGPGAGPGLWAGGGRGRPGSPERAKRGDGHGRRRPGLRVRYGLLLRHRAVWLLSADQRGDPGLRGQAGRRGQFSLDPDGGRTRVQQRQRRGRRRRGPRHRRGPFLRGHGHVRAVPAGQRRSDLRHPGHLRGAARRRGHLAVGRPGRRPELRCAHGRGPRRARRRVT